MRDLTKRLEMLEAKLKPPKKLQIVVKFIGAKDGHALPFDPTWAEGGQSLGAGERIERRVDESCEAFKARASQQFADAPRYFIG